MFNITDEAETYVADLFTQQGEEDLGLKVDIEKAGTPAAAVTFNFCYSKDLSKAYSKFEYKGFIAFIDEANFDYLKDSEVALKEEGSSKKLTITAPNAKGEVPKDDAPLEERIKYTIAAEVNPQLASHGGFVDLVEITKDMDVILNFGGGCQGCSSVKITLKNGVEAQLKALYPEIKNILDVTDHTQKENAYM
ncbi:NfuA Fe-S protein maturation [Bathymodiolus thermophilus thioautotrophic gill symbiont]|uniref:Fe/S biogenesis protein NfuA n=1 Tax=Bathymodiolus thermophilus thioautotrophic gill symbiont TaxID=2360 RepID=A0A1J5TRZ4_9GAMM|nr:NfuA family Fe-S biogenesis protein [Bathymodiolus thermophilus thioautotrophic gill symbiont]AYQ57086.1 Fe/S biogenesis protein NfuA [Bathymodiolus thermophilus thioautotrophic gill symbiont]OIR23682.1 Fe/S biogenesis protein NfuA [Bathymodiolus thermophilus thioautotrophic gill symbiont]CAB5497641.1 [4Fe-4S] cluster carrier protein NfuA [Bathymodiolus thermophilus thioautotrophic gill symbiont]CAB5505830.1 [4Fe-4S] cluster carrier protein NfuA [Bathymodiolus thermophilus thioautotrophic gi